MELRIFDFRNSKYQGEAINKQPGGFGISLDERYTFLLTEWKHSIPVGPFLAIFDDSTKLQASDSLLNSDSLIVYSTRKYKIFRKNKIVVIDCINSSQLMKIEYLKPNEKHHFSGLRIKVLEDKKYSSENYRKILNQMLEQRQIPSKFFSYQNFIKQTFKAKYRHLFNVNETAKQFSISFHQQGLFIKLSKGSDRIAKVGFMGANGNEEIGRKYSYLANNTCVIQQSINTQICTYFEYQKRLQTDKTGSVGREKSCQKNNNCCCNKMQQVHRQQKEEKSKQCVKSLREYYKRSLTFINRYFNLSSFYELKNQLDDILKQIDSLPEEGRHAQVQLESNGFGGKDEGIRKEGEQSAMDWVGLKKEIVKIMDRRERSHKKSSNVKDLGALSPTRTNVKMNTEAETTAKKTQKKNDSGIKALIKSNPEHQNRRDFIPARSKSQRQLKYLDSQEDYPTKLNTENKYQPQRNEQYRDTGSLYTGSRRKSPISYKFKYVEESGSQNGPIQNRAPRRESQHRFNY